MDIITPTEIKDIAWEGELVHPQIMRGGGSPAPIVTLGQHEFWTAAQAMETEVGKKWTPPLGGADYWLVRWACTLRQPSVSIRMPAMIGDTIGPIVPNMVRYAIALTIWSAR